MPYLILAQSNVTARALGAWLELLGERPLQDEGDKLLDDRCMVVEQLTRNGDQGVEAFETVVNQITKAIAESAPLQLTVLVDSARSDGLNPLGESGSWDSLLAMLILAVPEVRWVFGVIPGNRPEWVDEADWPNEEEKVCEEVSGKKKPEKKTLPLWAEWHSLPTMLSKPWRNPLLDPTGLRNHVRLTTKKIRNDRPLDLSLRTAKAAAIDEEVHYALFHAYTAYRFGYRADAVTSWKLMETLFGERMTSDELELQKSKNRGFHLLMEDVNLYFPDRPAETHLSTFQEYDHNGIPGRASHCQKLGYETKNLESSTFRIIVTSGHSEDEQNTMRDNKEYVKSNKPGGWGLVLKPTGGMFDLWTKARLFERLQPAERGDEGGSRAGLAPGFVWPPPKSDSNESGNNPTHNADSKKPGNNSAHSAPGKLMLVASHLVRRADALRSEANTVEECIRGAVLATEALELLGYRTPTLALQALELKQWFETKAEVAFVGVGHHFLLERRFKEIERETRVAARFHHRARREASALDASVTIANRIALIFREAGQFDEEAECLRKLRWWNRKLSFLRAQGPLQWLGLCLLAYAEWLISSLSCLIISVGGWMLVFWLSWWAWVTPDKTWMEAVQGAVNAFVGANVEPNLGPGILFLSTLAALFGFFHLGVFVSYLYSAIARK